MSTFVAGIRVWGPYIAVGLILEGLALIGAPWPTLSSTFWAEEQEWKGSAVIVFILLVYLALHITVQHFNGDTRGL